MIATRHRLNEAELDFIAQELDSLFGTDFDPVQREIDEYTHAYLIGDTELQAFCRQRILTESGIQAIHARIAAR